MYEFDINNPSAFIFDIDGTLAERKGRGPYHWARVKNDSVKECVKEILMCLRNRGHKIIIFTGRDGCCEDLTKEWLEENQIPYDHFDIRPEGNTEKDSIVKKRMFDKIKDKYAVLGVFDDRDQVVEMWRSLGLQCFQVDYGNF